MNDLTKYEALIGELEPYTVSRPAMSKSLADAGVSEVDGKYNPETDRVAIAKAAVSCLNRMVVLTSDSLGKSAQGYNVDELKARIKSICNANGLETSDFVELSSVTDGSMFW